MRTYDILNQQTTVILGASGYGKQTDSSIGTVLFHLSSKWKEQVGEAQRILKEKGKKEYTGFKQSFPVWFPSGVIANGDASDNNMVSHTNLIALDIDHLTEEELISFRNEFFNEPYVVSILRSVSGEGLFVLVYVEDWKKTKGYYNYFASLLKQRFNIELDTKATNIARKRFISWDDEMDKWIKPMDADITPWRLYLEDTITLDVVEQEAFKPMQRNLFDDDNDWQVNQTRKAIWALLNSGFNAQDRGYWYHCGCDFAAFADGQEMFDKLCSNWGNQTAKDTQPTWKECMAHPTTINDDLHRKWQGMAKNRLGLQWWKKQPA